jgi:hypothetical protein
MDFNFYMFIGLSILTVFIVFGFHLYANLNNIRANWSKYRCNPLYMPFAWLVSPEDADTNFSKCMSSAGTELVKDATDVFGSEFSLIEEILSAMADPLSIFRNMLSRIRSMMMSFTNSTLAKASGPVSAFAYVLNKIQDLFRRMSAQGYISAFFGISVVSFIEGFVTLCISIIKGFVIAMLVISIILALFQPELLAVVLVIASLLARAGA